MKIVYDREIYEDLTSDLYVCIGEVRKHHISEEYCCEEMESAYDSNLITYEEYLKRWIVCIDTKYDWDRYIEIAYCPWCGEKIETIENNVTKFKRKEVVKIQEIVEKTWEPIDP